MKARVEILVPLLGVLVFRAMLNWQDIDLTGAQIILIYSMAGIYVSLVLWSPMALPFKEPRSVTRREVQQIAIRVALLVLAGFLVLAILSLTSEDASGGGGLSLGGAVAAILLMTGLGTAGVAAERGLPVDLFPVLRRIDILRIIYVIVAAFFLAMVVQLWSGIFSDLATGVGRSFGEAPPADTEVAALFGTDNPLHLLLNFLVGAGLFEELLFRVGIMTPVWVLTQRWSLGLLVSALVFGLYHLSPLSGLAAVNLQAPITAVLESFGAGLAMGVIYRYRGFMAAVMTHALGNWLVVMFFLSR